MVDTCDPSSGEPTACTGCQPGLYGSTCTEPCSATNCASVGSCEQVTGAPDVCTACLPGFYGPTCTTLCPTQGSACTSVTVCEQDTGAPVECDSCELGYSGADCSAPCPSGTGQCATVSVCAQDGTALFCFGCEPGYYGVDCASVCVPGGDCLGVETCDQTTGVVTECATCAGGLFGPLCSGSCSPVDRGLGCHTKDQAVEAMLAEGALTLSLVDPDLEVPLGPPDHPAAAWRHERVQEAAAIEASLEHRLDLALDAELEVLPRIDALPEDVAELHQELEAMVVGLNQRDLELGGLGGAFWRADGYRCCSPTCTRRDVTPHHLLFRGRGGGDEDSNLSSLCVRCHLDLVHGNLIVAEPPAADVRWVLGRGRQMEVLGRELKRAS